MSRRRISMKQFKIDGPVFDGGVVCLVHQYRNCNWRCEANGWTPMELVWETRDHARVCDGERKKEAAA